MNVIKKLYNFNDNIKGGGPLNNRFNDTNIRQAISLWTSGRSADRIQATRMYGDISRWDVSRVTDMSELFKADDDFNDDISNWNVENVTNMREMFYLASSFNQPIGRWNVSKVTNMESMFAGAYSFNQPLAIWERADSTVGNVTDMEGMFRGAHSFNNGDNGNNSASPLTWDVANVTTMYAMFHNARAFNQPIGQWNVGNVNDMGDMFYEAYVFNQPIDQWNVGNGTNMQSMFRDATVFLQRYPDARNNPRSVFTSTETNTPNGIEFNNQTLRDAVGKWVHDREEAFSLYDDINTWNVSQVTDMNKLFAYRTEFNDDISNWDVGNVTNMEAMFYDAHAFNQPLGRWNVSNVTNMRSMFYGASRFNQPLANWERNNSTVGNVTNMSGMFYDAYDFNQPLEQWNVGSMTHMQHMFRYATAFLQRYPNADEDPRSVFTSAQTNTPSTPNNIINNDFPIHIIDNTRDDSTNTRDDSTNPQMNLMSQFNDSEIEACPMSDDPEEGNYVEVKNIVLEDPSNIQDNRDLLYNKTIKGVYISENLIRILDHDNYNNFIKKDIQIYPNPRNGAVYRIINKYDYLKDEHVRFINSKLKINPNDKIVKYPKNWGLGNATRIQIGYVDNNTVKRVLKKDENGKMIRGENGMPVMDEIIDKKDRLYNYADFIRFFIENNIHINQIPLFVLKFEGQRGIDYSGLFKSFLADFVKSISRHNSLQKNFMTTSDKDCLKFNKSFNLDLVNVDEKNNIISYMKNNIANFPYLDNYDINKILYSYFTGSFLSRIITLEPHNNVSNLFSSNLFIPGFILDPYILLSMKNYANNLISYSNQKIDLDSELESQMEFIKYFKETKNLNIYLEEEKLENLQIRIRQVLIAKQDLNILFPSDIYTIEQLYNIYSKIPERSILRNSESFEILELYKINDKSKWDKKWKEKRYSNDVREIFSGFTNQIKLPDGSIKDIDDYDVDENLFKIEYENKDLFIKILLRNQFEHMLDGTALSLLFFVHGFFSSYYGISDKIKTTQKEFLQRLIGESLNSPGLGLNVNDVMSIYKDYINDPINGFELDELDELFSGPKDVDRKKLKESIKITYQGEVPADKKNDQFYKDKINEFIDNAEEFTLKLMLKYITAFYTQITNEIIFNIKPRTTEYNEDTALWYTSYDGLAAHTCFSTIDVDYRIFQESGYVFSDNDTEREKEMKELLNELNNLPEEKTEEQKKRAEDIKLNVWLYTYNINKTLFNENYLYTNTFSMAGGGNNELITSLNNFRF